MKAQAIVLVKDDAHRQELLESAIIEDLSLIQIKESIGLIKANSSKELKTKIPPFKGRMDEAYWLITRSRI